LVVALGLSLTATADVRSHGAHVHGSARMDVAVVGDELEVMFEAPAVDIVGFEHEPSTEQHHAALQDALAHLRDSSAMIELAAAAGCNEESAEARRVAEGHHGHDDHHDSEDHHAHEGKGTHQHESRDTEHTQREAHHGERAQRSGGHGHDAPGDEKGGRGGHAHDEHAQADGDKAHHAEIHTHYRFRCADPQSLNGFQVRLFEHFSSLEQIRVQLVTDTAQSAMRLTPNSTRVDW
ncbi:MAG: DUF2796 domain-containing protein, partial [Halofilum sp. (in: g-proteobacteria)]